MHYGRLLRFLGLLALYIYLSPKDNPLDKVLIKNAEKIIKIVEKGVKGKKINQAIVAPTLDINRDLYLNERGQAFITTANLNCFDRDSRDNEIIYEIILAPMFGKILLNGVPLLKGNSFSQADLRSEKVVYKHVKEGSLEDELQFSLKDSDGIFALNASVKNPGKLSIFIKPVNDRPRLLANTGVRAVEQKSVLITATVLNSLDADNAESNIYYTLVDIPKFGVIVKNKKILKRDETFTQNDITQGKVFYQHRSESNETDNFKFSVSDSKKQTAMLANDENPAVFEISIEPVNDAPRVLFAKGKKIKEQGKVVLNARDIRSVDVDNNDKEISYVLARPPRKGFLLRDGRKLGPGDSFTQEELYDNAITYVHDGSDSKMDSFKFSVKDSGNLFAINASDKKPYRFKFSVLPVNDRPRLQLNNDAIVRQFSKVTLDSKNLKSRDVDNLESEILYKVVSAPKRGELKLDNSTLGTDDYFTQSDIDNGLIVYEYDDDNPIRDEFQFSVSDRDGGVSENASDSKPATFVLKVAKATREQKRQDWKSFYPSLSFILGKVDFGGSYSNPNAPERGVQGDFREATEIGGSLAFKVAKDYELELGLLQRTIKISDTEDINFKQDVLHTKHVFVKLKSLYERWNFGLELSLINHSIITYRSGNDYDYFKRKHPVVGFELINSDIVSIYNAILSGKVGAQFFKGTSFGGINYNSQNSVRLSATLALEKIVGEFSFVPELVFVKHKTVTNVDSQEESNLIYRMRLKYRL
jgi:hypothetical protein